MTAFCPECARNVAAEVLEETTNTTTLQCPDGHRWAELKAKPTVDAEPPQ